MAIRALTLSSVKTIESEQDEAKGTPEATKFTIGAIDAFVSAYIQDRALIFADNDAGLATAQVKMAEGHMETVRFGLKSWEHFKDAKGDDVAFATNERIVLGKQYTVVSDDCLARMNLDLVQEISKAIKKINEVAADEGKKRDAA